VDTGARLSRCDAQREALLFEIQKGFTLRFGFTGFDD
jgi:hypothetical protein